MRVCNKTSLASEHSGYQARAWATRAMVPPEIEVSRMCTKTKVLSHKKIVEKIKNRFKRALVRDKKLHRSQLDDQGH
jgi:hypothetical protein